VKEIPLPNLIIQAVHAIMALPLQLARRKYTSNKIKV